MENKSLNPVCVNNRNVFSWSHIYNCYFGQTADGRIVNIPTLAQTGFLCPAFSGNLLLLGLTLKRVSGDCGCIWLSPSPIPFLSCCLLFLFLGPPCFLYPWSYLLCTPPGCRLFFLARGAATGLGATAPGADVSAASWAAWPGWLQPRHTLSPEHHLLCQPILLLQQPLGEEACARDGNGRLASLSRRFSVSSHLPCLEPQCWACGVVGGDASFLLWAVHTLEEGQEALTHADLMILDVSAFVSPQYYPYAKLLHGFLWKLPGCWEKSRAACVRSSKQQPSTCHLVFIVRGKKGRIILIWEMSLRNSSNLFLGIILH